MPTREIALDTAAFLDSPQAADLGGASRADAQLIVELFLECAYDDVGKAPRLLDGDDLHAIVGHLLPARFARKDPTAAHAAAVLRRYLEFVEQRAIVPQAYEMRAALESTIGDFERAVATGHAHTHGHDHAHGGPPAKPFVNRAAKVGRNDPCPCGSGKKFKQCCAKL